MTPPPSLFGAALAGGGSRRFGSPKARARLRGVSLLERALAILDEAGLEAGVIANRAKDLPERIASRLPVRGDQAPGAGPLEGLRTALAWARERGDSGVFLLGCDLPLVPSELIVDLCARFTADRPALPASGGPLGMEPLCACYPVSLEAAATKRIAEGRRSIGAFAREMDPFVLSLDHILQGETLKHAFLNVNTPRDLERAARWLARIAPSGPRQLPAPE